MKEVIAYIQKAGKDIDDARQKGGEALESIALMVNKEHIPEHSTAAIMASLDWQLGVINYSNLNIDKGGLKQIMDLSVEAGMIAPIDIDAFADNSFDTNTEKVETQKTL